MKTISITNRELDYGIPADHVFWVENGILTKDNLRQSRDEELVADLLAYMVSDDPVASRIELLDDYFGASFPLEGARLERFQSMDQAVRRRNPELIELDYQRTHDAIVLLLHRAQMTFSQLIFPENNSGNPIPRYYQAIFLAINQLIVKEHMTVSDAAGLVASLSNSAERIVIQEGGRWGADNRSAAVKTVIGLIRDCFEQDTNSDPATVHWVSRLENLLTNSKTEQSAYDFKQGFMSLSNNPKFDENSFEKILETCSAIANIGKGHKGYVIVGVADKASTATRVENTFGVKPVAFDGFYVTGVEHEAAKMGKNLDQLFQELTDRIKASKLSEPLKSYVNSHLKCVRYYDKTAFVFEAIGQEQPSLYGNKYFERQGTQVLEVEPQKFPSLFSRFK